MNKINNIKRELNKMVYENDSLCNEELLEVSQFLDKMLIEHIKMESNMMDNKKDYGLEFEEFIDLLPCAIYVLIDSVIIDCNKAALDVFGYENKNEIIGHMPYELSPKYQDDGKLSMIKGQDIIDSVLNDKRNIEFQWKHKRKNDEVFLSKINIFNKNGILYVILMDISENSKLKEDLNEKDYLYHALFENHTSVMLVIKPETGKIVEANKAAIHYYGYSREKILSMNINEINMLNDNEIKQEIDLAVRENRNYFKFTHKLSNNTNREVEVHSFPVVIEKEKLLFSIVYDVEENMKQKFMFDKLLLASPYAVAMLDREQKIINVNSNFTNLFHYTFDEVEGCFINSLVSPNDFKSQVDNNIELIYKGEVVKQEGKRKIKNGELIDVEIIGYPVLYHQAIIGVYIIYIDISHKKSYEKQLKLFKKILENNTEGVFITDNEGCIEWINNAFTNITGYSYDEILNKKTNVLESDIDDEAFYKELRMQLFKNGLWQGEVWSKNKDGDNFAVWFSINSIRNENNDIAHFVGVMKDLSEKKKIDRRMIELQQNDVLTGLYNRNYFMKIIDKHIAEYKNNKKKFSILVIDIDEFKDINDSMGHNFGDNLLIEISSRILSLVKDNSLISRIDGDEFAILYENDNKKDLISFSKQLLKVINVPYKISNTVIYLNFNIGISSFPVDGINSEILVRFANVAINKSKKRIEERVCFYSNEISIEVVEKFHLANYLFSAISNNELTVYYQPIFDIKQKKIVGAEALLRWKSPILGNVTPEKFIPVAEKTGQIFALGEWVIKEVCKQMNLWQQKSCVSMPISINVSVKQLEQDEFAKTVIDILNSENINTNNIELEITESVSSGDVVKIVKNIKELKKCGIKISMDDFGTGFSSLGQLSIFELDKLKIDKIFIDDLINGIKRHNLVKSIIAMAKSLNLVIVAEGIETNEQLIQLNNLGCDLGQGYLFSEPLSVNEFEFFIKQDKHYKYMDQFKV